MNWLFCIKYIVKLVRLWCLCLVCVHVPLLSSGQSYFTRFEPQCPPPKDSSPSHWDGKDLHSGAVLHNPLQLVCGTHLGLYPHPATVRSWLQVSSSQRWWPYLALAALLAEPLVSSQLTGTIDICSLQSSKLQISRRGSCKPKEA